MPLDPQLKAIFAGQPEWPPVRNFPIDALTQAVRFSSTQLPPPPATLSAIGDRTIPGPGGEIRVRAYTPEGAAPFPLIVYFHGGSFVVGDLDTQDIIARGCPPGCKRRRVGRLSPGART